MTAEVFAEWLRRQGHIVKRTASSYWHDRGPRILQAFPYHWVILPQDDEIEALLRRERNIGVRYSTPISATDGKISYHVVLQEPGYSLEILPKKARYDVRKAAKGAHAEPISFARLAGEGWQLRNETLQRQGRIGAESQAWWHNLCRAADGMPGFEAWGVLVDDTLVASLFAFTCDHCCSILYQQSRTAYLSQGMNNLLTFAFTANVMQRPGVESIFYGLNSLDAPASVDEFKFRMGYIAKPVRQRVVFHPWLSPLFNPASHAALCQLRCWQPENPVLAKAEGMLRFYLEGKRPLDQQTWPEALAENAALDATA
ncbi:MAG: hypothetical protein WA029_22990 [Anaerolineae bacterium]